MDLSPRQRINRLESVISHLTNQINELYKQLDVVSQNRKDSVETNQQQVENESSDDELENADEEEENISEIDNSSFNKDNPTTGGSSDVSANDPFKNDSSQKTKITETQISDEQKIEILQNKSNQIENGKYYLVEITYVETIFSFYIRLKSRKNSQMLRDMQKEYHQVNYYPLDPRDSVYRSRDSKISGAYNRQVVLLRHMDFSKQSWKNNEPCAVLLSNRFYDSFYKINQLEQSFPNNGDLYCRGVVLSRLSNVAELYAVYLIDYGNVIVIDARFIYRLYPQFRCSAMAIKVHWNEFDLMLSQHQLNDFRLHLLSLNQRQYSFKMKFSGFDKVSQYRSLVVERIKYRFFKGKWQLFNLTDSGNLFCCKPKLDSNDIILRAESLRKRNKTQDFKLESAYCKLFKMLENKSENDDWRPVIKSTLTVVISNKSEMDCLDFPGNHQCSSRLILSIANDQVNNFTCNLSDFYRYQRRENLTNIYEKHTILSNRIGVFSLPDLENLFFRGYVLEPINGELVTQDRFCVCLSIDYGFIVAVPLCQLFELNSLFQLEKFPISSFYCHLPSERSKICSLSEFSVKLLSYDDGVYKACLVGEEGQPSQNGLINLDDFMQR